MRGWDDDDDSEDREDQWNGFRETSFINPNYDDNDNNRLGGKIPNGDPNGVPNARRDAGVMRRAYTVDIKTLLKKLNINIRKKMAPTQNTFLII